MTNLTNPMSHGILTLLEQGGVEAAHELPGQRIVLHEPLKPGLGAAERHKQLSGQLQQE
jgi:hypothetical protein